MNYKSNYAFIDSQNLNLAIRDLGWNLDFAKLRIYLKHKFHIDKAFLFIGYIPRYQKLYKSLKNSGYKVVFKPTVVDYNGFIKGNVDAELVLHTMIEFNNFKKAVIVTGDGDFHCLLSYLKRKNKLLALGIPNKYKFSALLRNFNKESFYINFLQEKLEIKKQEV